VDAYLLIEDRDALPLILGAVAAHWVDCSPVWLMLIGPPSSAKTELIVLLRQLKHVHLLSDLSPNTLASGFNVSAQTKEPSLLTKLTNHVIAIKEMTTILEKRAEARGEIFAQLREVYDGVFNKSWGTGKELEWEGRISLIAGVTDEIDRHHAAMSALGPRFLFLRMRQPDRTASARRALGNRNIKEYQKAAQKAVSELFQGIKRKPNTPIPMPETPASVERRLIEVAEFVTRARSVVQKDEYGNAEFAPSPEAPGRFVRQLHGLSAGLAVIDGRTTITLEDVGRVERVAMDCLPPTRRLIIDALGAANSILTASELERRIERRISNRTIQRELDALALLGTVGQCDNGFFLFQELTLYERQESEW
jgi:hypothetical protein